MSYVTPRDESPAEIAWGVFERYPWCTGKSVCSTPHGRSLVPSPTEGAPIGWLERYVNGLTRTIIPVGLRACEVTCGTSGLTDYASVLAAIGYTYLPTVLPQLRSRVLDIPADVRYTKKKDTKSAALDVLVACNQLLSIGTLSTEYARSRTQAHIAASVALDILPILDAQVRAPRWGEMAAALKAEGVAKKQEPKDEDLIKACEAEIKRLEGVYQTEVTVLWDAMLSQSIEAFHKAVSP